MNRYFLILLCLLLLSCSSAVKTLKYGYLPGSNYQYYSPLDPVDLQGHPYRLVISDGRSGNSISCSSITVPRDTELEGAAGYDFFSNYARAMIEANNGVVDSMAMDIIEIQLRALSGNLKGFVYGHIWGMVEFDARVGQLRKTYCSAMRDGDKDAPLGAFSADTRKGAFRKLVSGSARRALEEFIHDRINHERGTQ